MIMYMEMTCRDLVKPLLDLGHDTVGTEVNVRHLAASPIGFEVTFRAAVTGVDGRRVTFRVEARDRQHVIGEGTHERAIVDIEKFAERLRGKRQA
jgi:predicted thioesterase